MLGFAKDYIVTIGNISWKTHKNISALLHGGFISENQIGDAYVRVSWSKAQRWRPVQGKPSPRCKISRGGDHYIVKPLTTMFSEQCGQKRLFNEQCSPFSIDRCILIYFIIQRGLQVYFRCPLCQSLLSIMWNSTLMKMSKLGGHLGEQKHPISMSSTSRKLDYLTFPLWQAPTSHRRYLQYVWRHNQ